MSGPVKVLILGGYGTFGGRLAQLLVGESALTLIIAGRSHDRAAAFCKRLNGPACVTPLAFDRDGDLAAQLARAGPDLIVDASGPFQTYGGEHDSETRFAGTGSRSTDRRDPYRLVRTAIAGGVDYLDLADGSDFVEGIAQFDAEARVRGVFVLSGVSSFPVLTAAVARRLAEGLDRVDAISAGIA